MNLVAPEGSVYQAGTLSGNPIAVAAGLAMLDAVSAPGFYEALEVKGRILADGLAAAASDAKVPVRVQRVGSMMTVFFTEKARKRVFVPVSSP